MSTGRKRDVIVIGGGHNGLVTAAYLARAGLSVLVLERRHLVGGACVTEETFPGFKVSTAAYVNSLFRKEIVRDLDLRRHGFEVLARSPSSFTPYPDGRSLMLGPDSALNEREIGKFSRRDAERYPEYEAMLERVAALVEPTIGMTPPDLQRPGLRGLMTLFGLGRAFRRLGAGASEAVEVLTGAARDILDRWFESPELKSTLATDAIIGAMASPSMPGTAYVLFHHVMGETDGQPRRVGLRARRHGRIDAGDRRGGPRGGRGDPLRGRGGADPGGPGTRGRRRPRRRRGAPGADRGQQRRRAGHVHRPARAGRPARRLPRRGRAHQLRERLAEDQRGAGRAARLPRGARAGAGPQHRGTIHICPDLDYIERAYDDAKYGRPSERPVLECTIPSVVDPTVAPPGRHLMSMFVQYAPYALADGTWDEWREPFADRCFALLDEYAPNFSRSVIARQVLTPVDIERTFNLTGGNIFQGAMTPGQLFSFRPVPGHTGYRTPIRGLYLCGAAAHPGGGVMGAPGWNAARQILRDRRRLV